MMILIILASHLFVAALVAILISGLCSGRMSELRAELQTIRTGQAEIARRYNRMVASYGLAEPLANVSGEAADRLPPPSPGMGKGSDPSIGAHH